jgi:hypothetical protein
MSAELPLGDLEGALVLADLEQLRDALLIGSQSTYLADELADQGRALAELALAGGRALGDVTLGDLVAAVKPHRNAVANHGRRHRCERALCVRTPVPLQSPAEAPPKLKRAFQPSALAFVLPGPPGALTG